MHLQIARSINKVGFSIIIVIIDAIINIIIITTTTTIRSPSIIVGIVTNVLDSRGILFQFPERKDTFLFS
jgi:hypothetical protein